GFASTCLRPPGQARRQPVGGGFELPGIARKAQAQKALSGWAERGAGRKSHAGLIDQAQREAARVALAVDRKEQVEGPLRDREAAAAGRPEYVAHDVAALPRPRDLMRHE